MSTSTPVATTVAELSTLRHVTLDIGGMTCASCVRRVEKSLARVDGVELAEVNLATEAATVAFDPGVVTLDALPPPSARPATPATAHVDPRACGRRPPARPGRGSTTGGGAPPWVRSRSHGCARSGRSLSPPGCP